MDAAPVIVAPAAALSTALISPRAMATETASVIAAPQVAALKRNNIRTPD
jgi:hypothetical protein